MNMQINDKESLLQEKLSIEYNKIISNIMSSFPVFNNIMQDETDINKLLQIVNQIQPSTSQPSRDELPPNIRTASIRIKKINVNGFRGRNFELNCYDDDHTIFVMDNNTGKTTTLALLQWCFGYNTSDATTKFYHHTEQDRRVLDYDVLNAEHKVKIEVIFTGMNQYDDDPHEYKFTRHASGTTTIDAPPDLKTEIEEKIKQLKDFEGDELIERQKEIQFRVKEENIRVKDSLLIDYKDPKVNDEAHNYLSQIEGFSLNRDYDVCFFDSEQVQSFSRESNKQLDKLREKLREKIEVHYTRSCIYKINNIKELIQKEAGGKKNIGKANTGLEKKIQNLNDEMSRLQSLINIDIPKLDAAKTRKKRVEEDEKKLLHDRAELNTKHHAKMTKAQETIENSINDVIDARNSIASKINNWVTLPTEYFNTIISDLNEKSNLPEHIRDSLIDQCLNSNPPTCQVCKQHLDETAKTNIKKLKASLAKDPVYNFLSQKFPSYNQINIVDDEEKINSSIQSFKDARNQENSNVDEKIKKIDEQLELCSKQKAEEDVKILDLGSKININKTIHKHRKEERDKKFNSNETLRKWIPLQEQIDKIEELLREGQENAGTLALGLINEILAFAVPDATLGEQQAKLTDRGLESLSRTKQGTVQAAGVGVATEQITGYILSEIINDTQVVVIDSPAGAIGTRYRKSFAKHLRDQNKQVIAFCTESELPNFANVLSHKDPIRINQNKTSD